MVNEVEVEDPNAEPDEVCVYTIDHEVNVVDLSQSGCEVNMLAELCGCAMDEWRHACILLCGLKSLSHTCVRI